MFLLRDPPALGTPGPKAQCPVSAFREPVTGGTQGGPARILGAPGPCPRTGSVTASLALPGQTRLPVPTPPPLYSPCHPRSIPPRSPAHAARSQAQPFPAYSISAHATRSLLQSPAHAARSQGQIPGNTLDPRPTPVPRSRLLPPTPLTRPPRLRSASAAAHWSASRCAATDAVLLRRVAVTPLAAPRTGAVAAAGVVCLAMAEVKVKPEVPDSVDIENRCGAGGVGRAPRWEAERPCLF